MATPLPEILGALPTAKTSAKFDVLACLIQRKSRSASITHDEGATDLIAHNRGWSAILWRLFGASFQHGATLFPVASRVSVCSVAP
jgi:hypothetical protein